MDESTVLSVITLVGVVAIIQGFTVLTYRVGGFSLIPGEKGRLARGAFIALLLALALPFLLPLTASNDLVPVALAVAGLGYLWLTRARRARLLEERSASERDEIQNRVTFMRSGTGIILLVGMIASMVLWSLALVIVWSALP